MFGMYFMKVSTLKSLRFEWMIGFDMTEGCQKCGSTIQEWTDLIQSLLETVITKFSMLWDGGITGSMSLLEVWINSHSSEALSWQDGT